MDSPQSFTTAVGVEVVAELLVIATAVALLCKKVKVPYTVALVLVGLGVGFTHLVHPIGLSTDIILLVFLPPLLFEGTVAMDLATLREKWVEVLLLALPVTLACVFALGAGMHWALGFPWPVALLVGAILAPTDPVSVLAILRETGVSRRLSHIIDGESCFNDGVGVVVFLIISKVVAGGPGADVSLAGAVKLFGVEVLGGLAVGTVVGTATHLLLKQIDDHLVEVMISVALAYGSYLLADRLHVSGVMAVVAAGLVIGNWGRALSMSPTTRLALHHFWEVMAFIANSLLFLLMGIAVESARLGTFAWRILFVFVLLTVARAALVHATALALQALGRPMLPSWRHVIAWAGLRGSIPVALALGVVLPQDAGIKQDELLTLVFGVVLASLLVQGLTIKPLIRRLGLAQRDEAEAAFEQLVGKRVAVRAALARLHELERIGQLPPSLRDELERDLEGRNAELQREMHERLERDPKLARGRRDETVRALLLAEHSAVAAALQAGMISQETFEHLASEVAVGLDHGTHVAFTTAAEEAHGAGPAPAVPPAELPSAGAPPDQAPPAPPAS